MKSEETPRVDAPAGSVAVRADGWGQEVVAQGDLSPAAAAASARARIEARVALVRLNPRDVDVFREQILRDCRRPLFAAAALYRKPVGKKRNDQTGAWEEQFAEGFSIRFIEAALARYMHVHTTAGILYDDARKVMLSVEVLDVQQNVAHARDMMLEKTVERRDKKGRQVIGARENSYGQTVYIVAATPEEVRLKLGAEASKLLRDNGQRLLPPDILEEARAIIERTLADEHAKDPDAGKKRILDKFASQGVNAEQLKGYLARPIEALSQKDVAELAVLYNGLKDGEFSWAEVMRMRNEPAEDEGPAPAPAPAGKAGKLKDKIMQAREGTAPAAPAEPEQPK